MKVMFAGSRWLGLQVLETLVACRDLSVIGVYGRGRGWEPTDLDREAERLGLTVRTEHDLACLLANGAVDLCVSCCTSHIFGPREIDGCRFGIVNLHPAPLPYYRGCNSYAHAIDNGDTQYGVTLHYVDDGIDTGPIIARDWLAIEPGDTGRSLYERAQGYAANLFRRELEQIVQWAAFGGTVPGVLEQDESQARYYRRDSLDGLRDYAGLSVAERARRVRALTFPPFPAPPPVVVAA
jgi:methionyl-tRNA formyltransferase